MLRHSRAHTYWINRKHKERDREHTGKMAYKVYFDQSEEDYLKRRYRFNLRRYLKDAWGI